MLQSRIVLQSRAVSTRWNRMTFARCEHPVRNKKPALEEPVGENSI